MKVLTVTLLVLLAIFGHCQGYSYIIPASTKHPGVCYFNGHMLPKGDNQMPHTCMNMKCNEDGSILVQGCGHFNHFDCTLVEGVDTERNYPDCCEMVYQCKDQDGKVYNKRWNNVKDEL